MADVFVDLDKSASTEDGTTWANAFRLPSQIVVGAGDFVWIKGNTNAHSGSSLALDLSGSNLNPARVCGVKSATTNEPPVASDLIPGWRTGESRTLANRAYNDADRPVIAVSTSNFLLGNCDYVYGIEFRSAGSRNILGWNSKGLPVFEECLFTQNGSGTVEFGANAGEVNIELINCGYETGNASATLQSLEGGSTCVGLEYIATIVATDLLGGTSTSGFLDIIGADFSAASGNLVDLTTIGGGLIKVLNSSLHSDVTLFTGSRGIADPTRVEIIGCSSTTGKSSGSFLDITISTPRGDIADETTAVRTGGADDGEAGAHSMAMTPIVNATQDQYAALIGPWMAFWVTNSDTAVGVFIANSGAADYNDDDAWLEVMDVSNGGTAQHTHFTTQMDLLATPAAIADDTGSTWGTGGNNHQKLSVTISPDFSGWSYCRVHFAKNFGSSPETLYVDPNPITS